MTANLWPVCVCPSRGTSLARHHDPTEQRRNGPLLLNHRSTLAVEPVQKPERGPARARRSSPWTQPPRSTTAHAGLVWPDLAYNLWPVGAALHWSWVRRRAAWAPFSTSAQVQFFPGPPSFSDRADSVSLLGFFCFYPYITFDFISVWMSVFQQR